MRGPDRLERTTALLERLLVDPQLRAEFQRRPDRTCRGSDLPELADELATGPRGTLALERRESRSSLAGAMIAAAAEGIGLVEVVFSHAAAAVDAHRAAEPGSGARSSMAAAPSQPQPDPLAEERRDEEPARLEAVAQASGQPAYPGDGASRTEIASWMARRATAVGVPEQLPVIAALAQSRLSDSRSDGQDAAGFFRMSLQAWDRGPYNGFAKDPDLQLAWFLDRAVVVRAERVAAGDDAYGQDPSSWRQWIDAAVGRSSPHGESDRGSRRAAQRLLDAAQPDPATARASGSAVAERAVQTAERYLGRPYRWGGASPASGFDCSGLVQYAYGQAGVTLPRVTHQQFAVGEHVGRGALRSGDIVFFRDATGYIHHEGIYLSKGEFLHAPRTGDVIKVSSLDEPYYAQQFAGGRRVGQLAQGGGPAAES